MTYLYRCTSVYKSGPFKGQKCQQRHSFKKKVEQYVYGKKCPHCKNQITYMDKWQMKKNKETVCNCGDPIFPHRAGSTVWCSEHETGPTEEDHKNRYGATDYG